MIPFNWPGYVESGCLVKNTVLTRIRSAIIRLKPTLPRLTCPEEPTNTCHAVFKLILRKESPTEYVQANPSREVDSHRPCFQIRSGKIGQLFRPDTFVNGNSGAGNNWAKVCLAFSENVRLYNIRIYTRVSTLRAPNSSTRFSKSFANKQKLAMRCKVSN